MILLDTDVIVDIVRGFSPAVEWIEAAQTSEFAVPGCAAMEVMAGCRNKADQDFVLQSIRPMVRLWLDSRGCEAAFMLFQTYRLSHSLGLLDALIAQVALSHDLPLHTFNQKHFSAVSGLRTIQPYRK